MYVLCLQICTVILPLDIRDVSYETKKWSEEEDCNNKFNVLKASTIENWCKYSMFLYVFVNLLGFRRMI